MLPDDDRKEFDSLDDFIGDRSLLDGASNGAPPEKAHGEAPQERGFVTAEPDDTFESFDKFIAKERRARFTGLNSAQRKVAVAMILTLAIAGTAIGAFLFTQTLTPPTFVVFMTKNCDPVPPTPSVIVTPNGFVIWECSASQGAFTVSAAGSATPTVSSGSPWTSTYIYKQSGTPPTTSCSTASQKKAITSGSAVSFVSGDLGDWVYCTDYSGASNPMPTITYSWSQ